jgi:hypothetical protein
MINFSVLMTPESKVSLDDLWEAALPEVIEQVAASGYTVEEVEEEDSAQAAVEQLRRHRGYRLEPRPGGADSRHGPHRRSRHPICVHRPAVRHALWHRTIGVGRHSRDSHHAPTRQSCDAAARVSGWRSLRPPGLRVRCSVSPSAAHTPLHRKFYKPMRHARRRRVRGRLRVQRGLDSGRGDGRSGIGTAGG